MFIIEIPSITDTINGNQLSLTIGGVKSYNLDNLYSRKGTDEQFKIFIGFQNKVCCNMCVWTDGFLGNLKVNNTSQLMKGMYDLVQNYNAQQQLFALQNLIHYFLTEHEFATLIGRAKLYNYLPVALKKKYQIWLRGIHKSMQSQEIITKMYPSVGMMMEVLVYGIYIIYSRE